MVFKDIQNDYGRIPRLEMWICLRERKVTEKYVRLVEEDATEECNRHDGQFWSGGGVASGLLFQHCIRRVDRGCKTRHRGT